MRDVDHHADAVHLFDHAPAERREPSEGPLVRRLAAVRVGQLAVPVVRQRHVPRAAVVELANTSDRRRLISEGVPVFDADERHLLALCCNPVHVGRRQRELDLIVRLGYVLGGLVGIIAFLASWAVRG